MNLSPKKNRHVHFLGTGMSQDGEPPQPGYIEIGLNISCRPNQFKGNFCRDGLLVFAIFWWAQEFLFEDDTHSTNWKGNAEPCGRCELKICSLWFRSNCGCARFFLRTRHVVISIATGLRNGETSFIFMNFLAFKFLDENKAQIFWRSLFWWVRKFLIS